MVKKQKKSTRSQLVKKLDTVFSQYIRISRAVDGEAMCVTCLESKPWKEMQNGHFFSRGRYPTRWDEDNCHVQCYRCNVALNGNYINYTRYMLRKYGSKKVDKLERKSLSGDKISSVQLEEMIEHYKNEVQNLGG